MRMEVMHMAAPADTDKKATINISISQDDKKYIKTYAIEHNTTVTQLIAEYVRQLRDSDDRRKE